MSARHRRFTLRHALVTFAAGVAALAVARGLVRIPAASPGPASRLATPAISGPSIPDPTLPPSSPAAAVSVGEGLPPSSVPGAVNPDVSQANIHQTICVSGWTDTVRPPVSYTDPLKRSLMAQAGLPASQAGRFELDHRWPLSSGGAPHDPRNLWLEPWDGPRGAHAKDVLEVRVQHDVCGGRLNLAQAQALWEGDWWKAVIP